MKFANKIMGVVLTLAILAGMIMTAVPVSAAELNWSNIDIPNTTNFQVTLGSQLTAMAAAPDGKTILAWDNGTTKRMLKSTDGGVTWTASGIGNGLAALVAPGGLKSIKVSPQFVSDTNAVATDGVNLFRTVNGGSDWFIVTTGAPFADTNITSVDVSVYYNGGGPAILVGYGAGTAAAGVANGGVALYITYKGQWQYFSGTTTTGTTSGLGGITNNSTAVDVYAVAFSPNYQSDTEILALAAGSSGTVLYAKVGDNAWSNDVAATPIHSGITTYALSDLTIAKMAFPSDYDYTSTVANKVFLGFSTSGLGADMFRIRPAISGGTSQVNDTSAGLANPLSSIAYIGNSSSGTVVIADINGGFVNSTDAVTSNSPNWNNANTPPILAAVQSATAPIMQYAGNSTASAPILFCATGGSTSAFYTSTDSSVFNGLSLINIGSYKAKLNAFTFAGKTRFLQILNRVADNNTSTHWYYWSFKSENGGPWKLFHTYVTHDGEEFSTPGPTDTYDKDNTIYMNTNAPDGSYSGSYGNVIYRSTDGGATWTHFSAPGDIKKILGFQSVDANNYYVSGYDKTGIYKNGSYTALNVDNQIVNFKRFNPDFWKAMSQPGGIYISRDSGATWIKCGTGTEFYDPSSQNPANSGFYVNTFNNVLASTVYALAYSNGGYNLVKYVVGTSSSWEIVAPVVDNVNNDSIIDIDVIKEAGLLYLNGRLAHDTSLGSNTVGMKYLFRTTQLYSEPQSMKFEKVPGTAQPTFGTIGPPSVSYWEEHPSYNVLFFGTAMKGNDPNLTSFTATNGWAGKVSSYNDVLVKGPATLTPKANAQVGATSDFTWKALTTVGSPEYDVQIAYDSAFNSLQNSYHTTGTILANIALPAGEKLYWRVRESFGKPLSSPWSEGVAFTSSATSIATAGLDVNRGPAAGATGVSLTPVVTWGSVPNSTYNFKISTDPAFGTAGVVDSKTGLTGTVYAPAAALKPNTNYFWEVQAVTNGISGDWVVSGFTTGSGNIVAPTTSAPVVTTTAAPAVAPTIIVTIPPQPVVPQETPGYMWVIIAIGAILIIAVIVLIARTRRV